MRFPWLGSVGGGHDVQWPKHGGNCRAAVGLWHPQLECLAAAIGFLIFWIAALAECERLPFDLPEAEEELVAGYQTEYAGMKFALFYLGAYVNLVLSALLVSVLYFGGWSFPIPLETIAHLLGIPETNPFLQIAFAVLGITMTLVKAYFFVFLAISAALDSSPCTH